jgi:hypothetical protein
VHSLNVWDRASGGLAVSVAAAAAVGGPTDGAGSTEDAGFTVGTFVGEEVIAGAAGGCEGSITYAAAGDASCKVIRANTCFWAVLLQKGLMWTRRLNLCGYQCKLAPDHRKDFIALFTHLYPTWSIFFLLKKLFFVRKFQISKFCRCALCQ